MGYLIPVMGFTLKAESFTVSEFLDVRSSPSISCSILMKF